MAKGKYDYFEAFERIADLACQEARTLEAAMQDFNPDAIFDQMNAMHQIENAADGVNHELYERLAVEFITPIERDDILNLSQHLDDIVDSIEDVMMRLFMYDVKEIYPVALEVAALIVKECEALQVAMHDFRNFKKSNDMGKLLIQVSDYEEAADKKFVMAIRKLHVNHADDPMYVMTWENMMVRMEKCCDACAHVGDLMGSIIMKNT